MELDQEHRLTRPQLALLPLPNTVRRDSGREPRSVTAALDNAGHKRRAVELVHLLRHADVLVHHRLVIADHVLLRGVRIRGFLETVRWPREQVSPERRRDELQQGDDVERAQLGARRLAVQEEIEQFEPDRVALYV